MLEPHTSEAGLRQLLQQKIAAHKTPVLYFYADWCGPCRRYRASLEEPELQAALANATLIKINIDTDTLLAAKYEIQAVPTFIKVDSAANTIAQITSDEWDNDVPDEIAAVMSKLVGTTGYDVKTK
ncbi:thioredoxin family protein [Hymenobacter sediminicola]|uniref:Thioredoxin family protein n=1 Tax=Hymenobacter sediminicola TaxID=2761579 RepID=A0A7G7WBM3_9BACT|nr:thioredoxin family protein [Hymenobacter sediminicola]QNH63766.1 thioredoxin family protein [Hymenobacter sediminicola]